MSQTNPIRIELACGHIRWYKVAPDVTDLLFCTSCDDYRPTAHAGMADARSYQEDFWSEPTGRGKFTGGCTHKNCGYIVKSVRSWYALRDTMNAHYMRTHTRFGASLDIKTIERLPKDAPPPF